MSSDLNPFNEFGFCIGAFASDVAPEITKQCDHGSNSNSQPGKSSQTINLVAQSVTSATGCVAFTAPLGAVNQKQITEGRSIRQAISAMNFKEFYRGSSLSLFSSLPKHLGRCGAVTLTEKCLNEEIKSEVARAFAAGMVGGTAEALSGSPFDVAKVALRSKNQGILEFFKNLPEGIAAKSKFLFTGSGGTIARNSVYYAAFYPLYRHLKAEIAKNEILAAPGHQALLAGALAGATATFLSTPINTAVMFQRESIANGKKLNFASAARTLLQEGGTKALFRGTTTALPIMTISMMISSVAEEFFKNLEARKHSK